MKFQNFNETVSYAKFPVKYEQKPLLHPKKIGATMIVLTKEAALPKHVTIKQKQRTV